MARTFLPSTLAFALSTIACSSAQPVPGEGATIARAQDDGGSADLPAREASVDDPEASQSADASEISDLMSDASSAPVDSSATTAEAAIDCEGAVVCDDFESARVGGAPDPTLWSIVSPDCSGTGTIAVDDAQSHSGVHSLKVTGGSGYCDHVFAKNTAIATLTSKVFLRWYQRLDAALGTGHTTFAAMYDAHSASDLRVGGQDGILMMNRQSDDATLPELSPTGVSLSVAPATSRWFCLEIEIDQPNKAIRVWVDGVAIAGLVVDGVPTPDVDGQWSSDASWAPKLTDLRLGWESYAGQAETLWIDDVIVAPARVGCE